MDKLDIRNEDGVIGARARSGWGAGSAVLLILLFALWATAAANAAPKIWAIDETQSELVLTIPDTPDFVFIPSDEFPPGISCIVKFRNQNGQDAGPWNDGNVASLAGWVSSDYVDGTSIEFVSDTHMIDALASGIYRPNEAAFDPLAIDPQNPDGQYTDTSGNLAAFGARIRCETITGVNADGSFLSWQEVQFDLDSAGPLPITSSTFDASQLTLGISSMTMDHDGLATLAGQPIPDQVNAPLPSAIGSNLATDGTITTLGSGDPVLTIPIDTDVVFTVNEIDLDGAITGQIVALPEPGMYLSIAFGVAALWALRRPNAGSRRSRD